MRAYEEMLSAPRQRYHMEVIGLRNQNSNPLRGHIDGRLQKFE